MRNVDTRYRQYRADDLGAMHALDVACFERPFRFSVAAMRRFAEAKNAHVVIAERSDVLAGFVIVHVEEAHGGLAGYVVTLDVATESRRSGIAGALMQEAEAFSVRKGCTGMALHVFAGNEVAMGFYAHAGFLRLHCEENFYGHGLDAWFYYKALGVAV